MRWNFVPYGHLEMIFFCMTLCWARGFVLSFFCEISFVYQIYDENTELIVFLAL